MAPRHLDPKIKLVWLAPEAIALFVIWLMASTGYMLVSNEIGIFQGIPKPLVAVILFIGFALFGGVPAYVWHHLTYINFTYELAAHELIIREGVLTRKRTVIPYGRIQNINTERTLFERMLGLATIKIETAGSNPGVSEGVIPGIGNRDELVQELLGYVEKLKKGSGLESEKEEKSIASPEPVVPSQEVVLKQMLEELKSIKVLLQAQGEKKVDFSEMREESERRNPAAAKEESGGRASEKEDEGEAAGMELMREEPVFRRQISKLLKSRKKPK